jgi:hypothetical protein
MPNYPDEKPTFFSSDASSSSSTSNDQQVISRPVRRHLVDVFLVIAVMLGVAAAGANYGGPYSRLSAISGGFIETGAVVGSVFGIRAMRQDNILRWGLLMVSEHNKRTQQANTACMGKSHLLTCTTLS